MATEVLSFCHRRGLGGRTRRGRLARLDLALAQAEVRVDGETIGGVALEPVDCTEALVELVASDSACTYVECEVDLDTRRATHLFLMIDEPRLQSQLGRGAFRAEEHLIQLAAAVWRDARVAPAAAEPAPEPAPAPEGGQTSPDAWRADVTLFPHQARTVAWMRSLEARAPLELAYAGHLRLTSEWYLDTEGERLTRDASPRVAQLAGGVCADGTGTGKTASVLRLVAETRHAPPPTATLDGSRYASRATLVIVPLNLVSQWAAEVRKFLDESRLRVLWLTQARDLREIAMTDLLQADLVVTTFGLLRGRAYAEMAESALGGRPRSRAALSAWTRQVHHAEPLLEAVHWRRVVVDELHEAVESARDLRQLRLLRASMLWGLTATPPEADAAQHLYSLLLRREKLHHPNLLARLVSVAVRSHADDAPGASPRRMVRVASEGALRERALLRARLCGQKRALRHIALSTEEDGRDVEGARARVEAAEERLARFERGRALASGRLQHVGELVGSLAGQPLVVFVQWKSMVRALRSFLDGLEDAPRVLLLDGNTSQRAATLQEFTRGGVLLLCLEDCIAGLHLPHARHVIFAHALEGDAETVRRLERQAIARCARPGQEGEVHVYSFAVADAA